MLVGDDWSGADRSFWMTRFGTRRHRRTYRVRAWIRSSDSAASRPSVEAGASLAQSARSDRASAVAIPSSTSQARIDRSVSRVIVSIFGSRFAIRCRASGDADFSAARNVSETNSPAAAKSAVALSRSR